MISIIYYKYSIILYKMIDANGNSMIIINDSNNFTLGLVKMNSTENSHYKILTC
jgi:hypothetical protein